MQFAPFPIKNPLTPSFCKIVPNPLYTVAYSVAARPWTCCRIFNRSKGATAVLETPPAIPPANKDFAIDVHVWTFGSCPPFLLSSAAEYAIKDAAAAREEATFPFFKAANFR